MSLIKPVPQLEPGFLVDINGQIIPDGELRARAASQLQEYVEKNKSRFNDWFIQNGTVRPPIKYDLKKQEWVWMA